MEYKQPKVPLPGEKTFIIRKGQKKDCRMLWLDRQYIATINLSSSSFKEITEETWASLLSAYVIEGKRCTDYVIEQGFPTKEAVWEYLKEGGRITNLDESCSCYVRLVGDVLRFENGIPLEQKMVDNHPESWVPFYPSAKMLEEESKKMIEGFLRLNRNDAAWKEYLEQKEYEESINLE